LQNDIVWAQVNQKILTTRKISMVYLLSITENYI